MEEKVFEFKVAPRLTEDIESLKKGIQKILEDLFGNDSLVGQVRIVGEMIVARIKLQAREALVALGKFADVLYHVVGSRLQASIAPVRV